MPVRSREAAGVRRSMGRPKRAVVAGSGGGSGGDGIGPQHPHVRSSRRRPKLYFRGQCNEPDHPSRAALPACAAEAAAGLPEDLRAAVLLVHHRQAAAISSALTPPRSETRSCCEARLSGEQIRLPLRRRRADGRRCRQRPSNRRSDTHQRVRQSSGAVARSSSHTSTQMCCP